MFEWDEAPLLHFAKEDFWRIQLDATESSLGQSFRIWVWFRLGLELWVSALSQY